MFLFILEGFHKKIVITKVKSRLHEYVSNENATLILRFSYCLHENGKYVNENATF